MPYLFITLPIVLLVWVVYSSRNVMLFMGRWMLRRRYDITVTGEDALKAGGPILVLPNHPALVDPLIVVSELHALKTEVRPLVDEAFFSNRISRHVLALFQAVRVPDFQYKKLRPVLTVNPARHNAVRRAKALSHTVLSTLLNGGNVLIYPSGHITADGRETIANRQLAYNVAAMLPEGIRIVAVRTRGLYGSIWSRVGGRPSPPFFKTLVRSCFLWLLTGFRRKRKVTLHIEDITAQSAAWVRNGRSEFNACLENWYNADIHLLGRRCEEAS